MERVNGRVMEFTKELLRKMLDAALAKIEANFDYLNELDSATGDGDHGTAILSSMKAAVQAAQADAPLAQTFSNVGWGIMNATGGSTSSLTGSFFLGMSDAADTESLSTDKTVALFAAGLASVETMTTAKVGDKTLMDALIPAVGAMKKALDADPKADLNVILDAAASAAQTGAESTAALMAKCGRAKNLGERSIGHLDAGAASMALLFEAFAEATRS